MGWYTDVEKALEQMSAVQSKPTRQTLIEFVKEVAKPTYPDTNPASLLETLQARAVELLREMKED